MNMQPILAMFVAVVIAYRACEAQTRFIALGDLPGGVFASSAAGISVDGSTAVGSSAAGSPFGSTAFVWTMEEGMRSLGSVAGLPVSVANGVANDAGAVVGVATDPSAMPPDPEYAGFRWTPSDGIQSLGYDTTAFGISADGSLVAGSYFDAPARWSAASGWELLGAFEGTEPGGRALAISGDGTTIVGTANYMDDTTQVFRWTEEEGMQCLDRLPSNVGFSSFGFAVSRDGQTIVGESRSAARREPFRWTPNDGTVSLTEDFPSYLDGVAYAVSGDGRIVGGSVRPAASVPFRAFVWSVDHGLQFVDDVLLQRGVALSGWLLRNVRGISADGRVLAGDSFNPAGQSEAWLAYLDPPLISLPCPADFNADSRINSQDFFDYLVAFFTAPPCCNADPELICPDPANFNHDHCVNSQDFFDFLAAFFAGC